MSNATVGTAHGLHAAVDCTACDGEGETGEREACRTCGGDGMVAGAPLDDEARAHEERVSALAGEVRADEVRPGDTVEGVAVTSWAGGRFTMAVDYAGAERRRVFGADGAERVEVDPSRVELHGHDVDDGHPCRMVKRPHEGVRMVTAGPYHGWFTRA